VLASQARRRGFESLHPLFYRKDVSSSLDVSLEELLLFVLDEKSRRRLLLRIKTNEELFFYCVQRNHLLRTDRVLENDQILAGLELLSLCTECIYRAISRDSFTLINTGHFL
jgi:hypothetical protein